MWRAFHALTGLPLGGARQQAAGQAGHGRLQQRTHLGPLARLGEGLSAAHEEGLSIRRLPSPSGPADHLQVLLPAHIAQALHAHRTAACVARSLASLPHSPSRMRTCLRVLLTWRRLRRMTLLAGRLIPAARVDVAVSTRISPLRYPFSTAALSCADIPAWWYATPGHRAERQRLSVREQHSRNKRSFCGQHLR